MTPLVKHAPPLITNNPSTTTWHHQRISNHDLFNNESSDRPALMMPRICRGFFLE
jgi:hypothetical protein